MNRFLLRFPIRRRLPCLARPARERKLRSWARELPPTAAPPKTDTCHPARNLRTSNRRAPIRFRCSAAGGPLGGTSQQGCFCYNPVRSGPLALQPGPEGGHGAPHFSGVSFCLFWIALLPAQAQPQYNDPALRKRCGSALQNARKQPPLARRADLLAAGLAKRRRLWTTSAPPPTNLRRWRWPRKASGWRCWTAHTRPCSPISNRHCGRRALASQLPRLTEFTRHYRARHGDAADRNPGAASSGPHAGGNRPTTRHGRRKFGQEAATGKLGFAPQARKHQCGG